MRYIIPLGKINSLIVKVHRNDRMNPDSEELQFDSSLAYIEGYYFAAWMFRVIRAQYLTTFISLSLELTS